MRITLGTTQYRWTPGSRTINVWTDTPYNSDTAGWPPSRWLETDVISFGYDKPDNTTTAIDALGAIITRLTDEAMDRHPAGRDTVSRPEQENTMNIHRDTSGELALTPRWSKCVICGQATSQPPVCFDLRCERAYEERDVVTPCPNCNGHGDTGPVYDPDPCCYCRGTGIIEQEK